jgi:hypothetical protein
LHGAVIMAMRGTLHRETQMISTFRRGALVAGGALSLLIAGAAIADPPAPPPPGPGATDPGMRPHQWRDPAQREAMRARRLSAILQLRPDQAGALHAFLEALTPRGPMGDHDGMGMRGGPGEGPDADADADANLTTPQRLDQMLTRMDEMRARLATRVQATKAFYAQLSPQQQQAFDALRDGMRRHGGDGPGRWGHGPDGRGPDGGGSPPG